MTEALNENTIQDEIDLGDDHRIVFTEYEGEKRVGANLIHPRVEGKCSGQSWIVFEGRTWANTFDGKINTWKVEKEEPITISPSILCRACNDHGFIREGKWVRA